MTDPSLYVAGAQAALDNAPRQGLTWRLIPGTIVASTGSSIIVLLDGDDTTPSQAQSLIGTLNTGQRVMVMVVPPQGNYVVGTYGFVFPKSQAGSVSVNVNGTSALVSVTFTQVFEAIPSVCVNMASAPGPSAGWGVRGINVTTTGFQIFLTGTSGTFTILVHWQAEAMTQ
jgi:hypothetical protein